MGEGGRNLEFKCVLKPILLGPGIRVSSLGFLAIFFQLFFSFSIGFLCFSWMFTSKGSTCRLEQRAQLCRRVLFDESVRGNSRAKFNMDRQSTH